MEDTFRDNFQGTHVRPPDADDLSHIVQQPGESARKFWTRFLTKKNQIIDCPDAEALAAFKHSIRDEWLARHLGQEKPKSMAALTALMTRFCAGEDSWLAHTNIANEAAPSEETTPARPDAIDTNAEVMAITPMTVQFTPDSVAPSPASERGPIKGMAEDHPAWTAYSIVCSRYMAPQTNRPTILTEIAGSLRKPARKIAETRKGNRRARTKTSSPGSRTLGA